ncbi:DUF6177 family protein [Spirillospora sp. NBC_01491]|uniref:DUF6177 family protein n=1 Tax=Spirillospora sp. NBC_01491 TaxID=2976007 RepID=UPI002E3751A9|nr:DUF6177 family protein [Spirillospora sp. NBC_01491]
MMEHPSLDLVTDKCGMVMLNRSVLSLSVRMSEALRVSADASLNLVVTCRMGRLTLPLRLAMGGPDRLWAVKGSDNVYYDGFSGSILIWDGAELVPQEDRHGDFVSAAPPEARQLLVSVSVRHPASERLRVGTATELVCRLLTGAEPGGWGTCEPAGIPWRTGQVTELCRARAPQRTLLTFVAGPGARRAVGTLEVVRTAGGVEERVSIGTALTWDEPLPDLAGLAERVASRFALVSMTAQAAPGRADLTTEARFQGLPAPIGLASGDGRWAAVGDGRDPADWERFREAMAGLGGA